MTIDRRRIYKLVKLGSGLQIQIFSPHHGLMDELRRWTGVTSIKEAIHELFYVPTVARCFDHGCLIEPLSALHRNGILSLDSCLN